MRSVRTTAAVGCLALALGACGGNAGDDGAVAEQQFVDGKTFTMALGADPGSLDPHFTSLSAAALVDRFMYDSLLYSDPNGNSVAGLAETWEGTTTSAKYVLRKGVTCANGTPLTATLVADNINFVGNPENASTRIGVWVPPGATAKGDDATGTVTVTAAAPAAFLVRTVGGLPIVCDRGMKDRNSLKQAGDGTGMFTLTEAVANDHYTFTRRKEYAWGPGDFKANQPGLPDTVILKVVTNESTAANLLMSKQANAAQIIGPDRQRLQAAKLFERQVEAPLGELWLNHKSGLPGSDEQVRRALVQALDLGELGKVVSSGNGKPATGLVAPGIGPCKQNTVEGNLPGHDVAAAKAALDAAGWTAGAGGARTKDGRKLAIVIALPSSLGSGMQAGVELAQKAWTEVGAEVTVKPVTDAEVGTAIVGGQLAWDAAFLPLGLPLPSGLVPYLSGPSAPQGVNFSGIDNAEYNAAVAEASAIAGTDGCEKWAAAEKAIFARVDLVPFVNSTVPTFGQGAQFEFGDGALVPQSIRMLA
ncbi:ABC transporter substrate-binding protein [Asanoa siamensis]|uniref:Peptide ABC transporter substrate-binding protein n=1 Tax=Asanoa siamensis TaxID=926357 RepID=A0ABQ4D0H4_9ACTN|nr:ABC transporter substrate-binding protein [Asanoa siamensis]GIF77040.1 peptide ABC transporter substrate-binding protein [Asanoa siamensis]